MSFGDSPSFSGIADIIGDVAPHSMSEFRGVLFSDGSSSPTTGAISLSDFRNKTLQDEEQTVWPQEVKTFPDFYGSGGYKWYGYSVSITHDGLTAVVGAPQERGREGAVYVLTRSGTTWNRQALIKLVLYEEAYDSLFGWSVAISKYDGNTLAIGAPTAWYGGLLPNGKPRRGAVYIYTRSGSTWAQQAKIQITGDFFQSQTYFGQSVALSADGNTLMFGAPEEAGYGRVYVYTRSGITWTQQAKLDLFPSSSTAPEYVGGSVSLSDNGNIAVIGASTNPRYSYRNKGTAFIYTRTGSTWSYRATIQPSDSRTGDYFGYSVSMTSSGDTIVVGALDVDTGTTSNTGAAYIFYGSGSMWSQQAKISASDTRTGIRFGASVSISNNGDIVVVGAPLTDDSVTNDSGATYVFNGYGSTWTQDTKIKLSDPESGCQFGTSVAIARGSLHIIAGAPYMANQSGAAYIFKKTS